MGHLPTTVNAMQRSRRLTRVEMQVLGASAPAQGVTGPMLQQPHCFRGMRIPQKPRLPSLLVTPGLFKRHRIRGLKKNCGVGVCQIASRT